MVLHIEVHIPGKSLVPNKIVEGLNIPQINLLKGALSLKYEMNKNISLLSDPIPIKYLPEGTKVLCSRIYPSIK